ncbi:MAG: hypothetical protein ABIB47_05655 [Candidatus Woesearchaeota archaeon]
MPSYLKKTFIGLTISAALTLGGCPIPKYPCSLPDTQKPQITMSERDGTEIRPLNGTHLFNNTWYDQVIILPIHREDLKQGKEYSISITDDRPCLDGNFSVVNPKKNPLEVVIDGGRTSEDSFYWDFTFSHTSEKNISIGTYLLAEATATDKWNYSDLAVVVSVIEGSSTPQTLPPADNGTPPADNGTDTEESLEERLIRQACSLERPKDLPETPEINEGSDIRFYGVFQGSIAEVPASLNFHHDLKPGEIYVAVAGLTFGPTPVYTLESDFVNGYQPKDCPSFIITSVEANEQGDSPAILWVTDDSVTTAEVTK